MTELKTLKDLEISADNPMYTMGAQDQRKVLRQEAIKWVRLFIQRYYLTKEEMPQNTCIDEQTKNFSYIISNLNHKNFDGKRPGIAIVAFIKHFFNITDKDLDGD